MQRAVHILVLLSILTQLACTPLARLRGVQVAAAATCAGGRIADAAGEEIGGILAAAACWLEDYTAKKITKLEAAQPEVASAAQLEHEAALAAAAEELSAALRSCDKDGDDKLDPSAEQSERVAEALRSCRSIQAQRP